MEKFDKNYIIGFLLMLGMYAAYMYFYKPLPEATPAKKTSSIITSTSDTLHNAIANAVNASKDSLNNAPEKVITIQNDDITVTLSNKGAKISSVVLNKYKTYSEFIEKSKDPLKLFDGTKSSIDFLVPTSTGSVSLSSLNFNTTTNSSKITGDSKSVVTFVANMPNGGTAEKTYTISGKGYEILENIKISPNAVNVAKPVTLTWVNELQILENNISENRKAAQINFYDKDEDFSDLGLGSTTDADKKSDLPVKWFSFKQKYFTAGLVSENDYLDKASFDLKTPLEDSSIVKIGTASAQFPAANLTNGKASFKFYFGPNELKDLTNVSAGFNKNLYLGYDIVKPINRYVFVPLFNWVESFVSNYGLLIILVVLIIKTVLTPLIYKSYVSSAKMRILAPEVAEIKEKIGDDAMKVQQETMKLYQQVGVSPLSGCVPLVLQMPILMSVFFLFPNMIMFRQKSFLWAHDLSTYDAPLHWATSIPLLGNHISLFVVLMTLSSLAFTYYNNQITPDQPGPIDMKKLSYIFPLVFFFVLNSFPAALSFYYLISNLVTIAQQLIVRKFVDEDKIKDILEKNRKNYATKPKKTSKFGDFLQKQLQASEEMKKQSEELKKKRNKK